MEDEIVEFKSISEYFYKEKSGLKNHTERVIDVRDERFQLLLRAWAKKEDCPLIRINLKGMVFSECEKATNNSQDLKYSFLRKVKDISIWGEIMSITWINPKEAKKK